MQSYGLVSCSGHGDNRRATSCTTSGPTFALPYNKATKQYTPVAAASVQLYRPPVDPDSCVGPVVNVMLDLEAEASNIRGTTVVLTSPTGRKVTLLEGRTTAAALLVGGYYTFSDAGAPNLVMQSAARGQAVAWGTYRPATPLSVLFGDSPRGTWTLNVTRTTANDTPFKVFRWELRTEVGFFPPPPSPPSPPPAPPRKYPPPRSPIPLGSACTFVRQPGPDGAGIELGLQPGESPNNEYEDTASDTLSVKGCPGPIDRVTLYLNLTYSDAHELRIRLQAPDGTTVSAFNNDRLPHNQAFSSGGYYIFEDGGSLGFYTSIDAAGRRITEHGAYAPTDTFYAFLGADPTGTWTLHVDATPLDYDYERPDGIGMLYEWILVFGSPAAPPPPPVRRPASSKICTATYAGPALRIPSPDDYESAGAPFSTYIYMNGCVGELSKVTLSVNVSHPRAGDVMLRLTSPGGQTATVLENTASDKARLLASQTYTFSDDGKTKVTPAIEMQVEGGKASYVPGGVYRPEERFRTVFGTGSSPAGRWDLILQDNNYQGRGVLYGWTLTIQLA
ncbi:hypothetical protein GPECTOR_18g181 [Gonium pectorale]|uniref:P/Homo B domain-containing protein n=1 Tax=Gonium pectorale TaxID=33097 RepID=A0A150GJN8_GONPE|nr:hypothetical protein GPECTOR_18g181 [Gonium pectorale]|eukprot:KXZ50029.1 hypothetical protein GPECTOR_18g181 [Gonium pectorale]